MLFANRIETTNTNYDSDVSDAEWVLIRDFMPVNQPNGRDMTTSMRDVLNAIFYQDRTGCQWRYLPSDFPPHNTVAGGAALFANVAKPILPNITLIWADSAISANNSRHGRSGFADG